MRYVPPFSSLNQSLVFSSEQDGPWVRMPYEEFENLLRRLLRAIEIDEEWYRRAYPDVDPGDSRRFGEKRARPFF